MSLIASLSGAYPQCLSGASWVTIRSLSLFRLAAPESVLVGPPTGEFGEELYFFYPQIRLSSFFSLSEVNLETSNSRSQSHS